MLFHVGIDNKDNESCVEELTEEASLDDGTLLLWDGIFTNPSYEGKHQLFKNGVDDDNDDSNGKGKEFGVSLIESILEANLFSVGDFTFIVFQFIELSFLVFKFLLSIAEALHGTGVKSDFSFFFNGIVQDVFIDTISHPGGSSVGVLLLDFDTVLFWILLLHGNGGLLGCENEGEWNAKHAENCERYNHCSNESFGFGEVTVLPNDISGLGGLVDINLTS